MLWGEEAPPVLMGARQLHWATDCPCAGQDVIPPLSQGSMQSMARCFSITIPGRYTAGSFHDQDVQPQLGVLAGSELCWTLQPLLLSISQAGQGEALWASPAPSFSAVQSFWSVLEVFAQTVMDAGWLRETSLGGRAKGRTGKQASVVGSVGLSWALLFKTSPLIFPTVFTALPGHCQGQALPGIPWH